LAGLGSCAGVTLAAVAHAMKIELLHAAVTVEGDADFCGTLGVNRDASVGLTALRINFELETDCPEESVDKLIELTHRYCVVHRTLDNPPAINVTLKGRSLQVDK
ncbi:MAG TPA: OsmC family protein, partial [Pirellulaceae bacterium]|nr:OsmC family protein [Pirellulaceae bacterium]